MHPPWRETHDYSGGIPGERLKWPVVSNQ
jgi:hypothetical protein